MKERGCDWSGTLEQLDTHLDPDQDNCQYVDTKCPLDCHMTIPKNKVEQHVAQHCTKRPYVCQYCNFKATYKEVVDKHLPECKYVPLQCPNLCGVTFERDFMEDHIKICRLEKVGCEFRGVGCDGRFRREDQEEHTRQNSQKHLTLTASLAVELREQLKNLQELEAETKADNQVLRLKLENQAKVCNDLKVETHEMRQYIEKNENRHKEDQEHLQETLLSYKNKLEQNGAQLSELASIVSLKRSFAVANFSKEKLRSKVDDWKSPAMYTHVCGYKFCIGVDTNGRGGGRGKAVRVTLWSLIGEYDSQLEWPVKAEITLELINQQGGENVVSVKECSWKKPNQDSEVICSFGSIFLGSIVKYHHLVEHSKLDDFLIDDTLHFRIPVIKILKVSCTTFFPCHHGSHSSFKKKNFVHVHDYKCLLM